MIDLKELSSRVVKECEYCSGGSAAGCTAVKCCLYAFRTGKTKGVDQVIQTIEVDKEIYLGLRRAVELFCAECHGWTEPDIDYTNCDFNNCRLNDSKYLESGWWNKRGYNE
jgi:hypothetical protein